jgi:hypothetical protein
MACVGGMNMIISGIRIRNVNRRLGAIPTGQEIVLGLTSIERFVDRLGEIGFPDDPSSGDTVLPATLGPVSRYNAEGKEEVHRNRPMETAYRQVEWHWTECHGRDRVEQSRIADVPYKRYPRTLVPPPSVEMTFVRDAVGNRLILTQSTTLTPENHEHIAHVINLFLELFGECNVMDRNLELIHHPRIRRINWTILPRGKMPWTQLQRDLEPVVSRQPGGNQPVIWHRLAAVEAHGPDFVAVGRGGFDGYLVLAFPNRNLYVLECVHLGNATYVFGDNWETLSKLSKAEILSENLQKARLIHREGWDRALHALFR